MYLCIDIGGTKTLVAAVDHSGKVTEEVRFETPAEYSDFVATLRKTIGDLKTKKFTYCCSALPGKIDREHGIGLAFGNLPWENVPLAEDLEAICHAPVLLENDANLAGLSEAMLVKDTYSKVLYVTISTGIGGVFVVNGVIDPNTQDAEIGHILLEHGGELMRWQEFASGKAISKKYGKRASDIPATDTATWYVIAHNIAVGLIDLVATYTPDIIILGGGVGTHLPKFKSRLEEDLKIYENALLNVPPIIQAQRPEEAVIYGCYDLIKQHSKLVD